MLQAVIYINGSTTQKTDTSTGKGKEMYYLFKRNQELDEYKQDFERVSASIKAGTTPVCSEIRLSKSNLVESIPYNMIAAILIVSVSEMINRSRIPTSVQMAILLVANNFCGAVANYIFTMLKHRLRLNLCKRMRIEPTEHNIAVMESMEYQSV